jgi:hypothetical protein
MTRVIPLSLVLLGFASLAHALSLILRDDFVGAAGSALTAHAPNINVLGRPWATLSQMPPPRPYRDGTS